MLNVNDVSTYLKISPHGLEASLTNYNKTLTKHTQIKALKSNSKIILGKK
jgi:hypothetical protein